MRTQDVRIYVCIVPAVRNLEVTKLSLKFLNQTTLLNGCEIESVLFSVTTECKKFSIRMSYKEILKLFNLEFRTVCIIIPGL